MTYVIIGFGQIGQALADRSILALQRTDEVARRLSTIPGVGPVGATALAASVADPNQFRSGREFAAWLGLTPSQNSSGGKDRLGRITKMGDRYLRKLLVIGATPRGQCSHGQPNGPRCLGGHGPRGDISGPSCPDPCSVKHLGQK